LYVSYILFSLLSVFFSDLSHFLLFRSLRHRDLCDLTASPKPDLGFKLFGHARLLNDARDVDANRAAGA